MNKYGFTRFAACSPKVRPGDIDYNVTEMCKSIEECVGKDVDVVLFPELSITGYTCADLFGQDTLLEKTKVALTTIVSKFDKSGMVIVVGAPIEFNNSLFNCAVVIYAGEIMGIVPKTHIPNYGEFYEKRWFASGAEIDEYVDLAKSLDNLRDIPFSPDLVFQINGTRFGIEICEDLWVPEPPSGKLCKGRADVILNLSATNELIGKHAYLLDLIRNQSARCRCGYVYASAGFGESSTDLAFAGNCIIAENGRILDQSERFVPDSKMVIADIDVESLRHDRRHFSSFADNAYDMPEHKFAKLIIDDKYIPATPEKLYRKVKAHPFLDSDKSAMSERCSEISSIQAWGLALRLKAINCKHAVIGISGGLDSTLALLVTVKAFDMLGLDRKGIIGITMPGFGTTKRTKSNASKLMELLGVTEREMPIGDAVKQHFKDIGQDENVHDVTYENGQARERTQILMDVANMVNGIVIGTGDLSELALGWCTYNGDQMSMYGVNASIPKTLVKYLVAGYAEDTESRPLRDVLFDIINTPISPELLPADDKGNIEQKTEDLVGPYELHDFFLYNMMRFGMPPAKIYYLACKAFKGSYEPEVIKHWLKTFYRRFFSQQFKRSCMPDGVKAGSICLSPRGDWRMPSDASANLWLKEIEEL